VEQHHCSWERRAPHLHSRPLQARFPGSEECHTRRPSSAVGPAHVVLVAVARLPPQPPRRVRGNQCEQGVADVEVEQVAARAERPQQTRPASSKPPELLHRQAAGWALVLGEDPQLQPCFVFKNRQFAFQAVALAVGEGPGPDRSPGVG